jgi:glycosyltransferase involved in cell wall biosynthesis
MLEERKIQPPIEVIDGFTIRRFANGPEIGTIPLTPSMLTEILHFDSDILHAHDILPPASFYSAVASKIKRKPLVVTQHGYTLQSTKGAKLLLQISYNCTFGRFTSQTASAIIGLSSEAVRFVRGFGASASKTKTIPNSVDTTLFRPDQRNLLKERWNIDGPVVLFVGRLEKKKSVGTLLYAFNDALLHVPDAKLVIIGKGPEENHLHEIARELNLNQVLFLGRLPRDEMPYIYPGCDFLVLPSIYEPFGNVVLEAMASGLPVIGSKIGGMVDIIHHGKTGYHVKTRDRGGLSRHLVRLLKDKELRRRMSEEARRTAVEEFDDVVVARAVERIYLECLER